MLRSRRVLSAESLVRKRLVLTPLGLKLVVLLVKLRTRLLGPVATLVTNAAPHHPPAHHNPVGVTTANRHHPPAHRNLVDTAVREVAAAPDHLSAAVDLAHAA